MIAAFLAGAATVLAFAPAGVYPVALFSLAFLIHLLGEAQPWRAFRIAFAFAIGMFLVGVSWVYVSLHDFGGMPAPLTAIATLLFCALLAFFFALGGWLQARLPASAALRAGLLIPAAWTLAEWSLSWVFTGFPWLAIGYAAAGWPTQGYAPLLGVFGVSFITVSLAGLVWLVFKDRREISPKIPNILPIVAVLIILGAGEALRRVDWTTPAGEPVGAALLQGNVGQEMKFRPERYAQILETYARLAEGTKARLIVLPETAVPRFLHQVDPGYLERLAAVARRNGGDLLLGVPFRSASGDYYNSVVSLGVSPPQIYHKVHLVPFGEFIPPGFGWVLRILDIPLADFARGPLDQPPLASGAQRIALNVCYEDAFGDEIRRRAARATLIVNVSNVAWFGDSLAPAQHLQIARLRAIENGRMYLTATNTGISAAVDRDGRVAARLPQFVEGRLEIAAQGYAGLTPYMRFGDWPIVLASLAALFGAAVIARRKLRR